MAIATAPRIAIVLWLLWSGLLGASLLWPGSPFAMPLRVASSAMLVAAAWTWRATTGGTPARAVSTWIVLGMTCGFLGDAWALVPERSLPVHRLIPAMILFGLGHLAYVAGFLNARTAAAGRWRLAVPVWAFWLLLTGVAWVWTFQESQAPALLRWLALGYSAVLGSTTAASTVLAVERPRFMAAAAGALLFLTSDLILGIQSFRGSFPHATELCWGTYGPGQMLIVYGMAWGSPGSGNGEGARS